MTDGLKITNFYSKENITNEVNSTQIVSNDQELNNNNSNTQSNNTIVEINNTNHPDDFDSYHGRLKNKLDKNLENIFMNYFKMYLNKFDNFNNQLYLSSVALEAYTNRINKVSSKINILNDFFKSGNEYKLKFLEKYDKLNKIDSKLSKLEIRTQSLVSRIADFERKISNINFSDKIQVEYPVNESSNKQDEQ